MNAEKVQISRKFRVVKSIAVGTRPRVLVQNQHTRELIKAQKTLQQTQHQRPEPPTVTVTWHVTYRGCTSGGVMYLVFTRMPDESYRR